jgi:uncharacterized protein (TIGR00296 family)
MSRLSNDDWLALVEIARRAIASAVVEKCIPDFPPYSAPLSEQGGAFVSLYHGGTLRGCVGQVENPGPLADVVARSAINAALHDSRFSPVRADEVASLDIEISVLSAPEPIAPEDSRLLEETCVKAGLPRDGWRDPATHVFGFTAEIFSTKGQGTISGA